MIAQLLNFLIMTGLLAASGLLWHKGMPAAMRDGRVKAVEIFLLGLVMGLFGVGRLAAFLALPQGLSIYTLGHAALLAYAFLRYRRLLLPGKVGWWEVGR